MNALLNAIAFLTRIPVPVRPNERDWSRSPLFYPVVGLVIGLLLSLFDGLIAGHFPPLVRGVLILGLWVYLTGGLHLDGLMDTADGFGAYRDRERTLQIMKDSRVGAMGVLAAILLLLLKASALASLSEPLFFPLVAATVAGRTALLLAICAFPYRSREGIGNGLKAGLTPFGLTVSFLTAALLLLGLAGGGGLLL
ncbi:adenosylcobinamide-GDP ribazoletransferase, partial [Paludifilum halophilum]|uniref:adenosylcobinamide-GDP ribazoletransferase n=1 Tax=Paludifilum halophilum TaxID=1642702 RepID=UPI00114019CE